MWKFRWRFRECVLIPLSTGVSYFPQLHCRRLEVNQQVMVFFENTLGIYISAASCSATAQNISSMGLKIPFLRHNFHVLFTLIFWLIAIKHVSCYDNFTVSCKADERKALLRVKEGLKDPSNRLSSWQGENCCNWSGVICNSRTGDVIKLNLRNHFPTGSLSGEISPSLLDLKHLSYLDLSMNNFEGTPLPSFLGSLTELRYLNLSGASFSGKIPHSLGNLSSLLCLDLSSYSQAEGNDLTWISGLPSLKYLNLGGVDLSKAASSWLQIVNMLSSLSELHLYQCQLTNLPPSFPSINFTSLSVLDLANNGFNSTIPSWLFNLSSLTQLDLSSNSIHGALPDEFEELISLHKLDLSDNSLLEGQLPRSLGKLCHLQLLKLSVNQFTGELADYVDELSRCPNSSLETMDLGYNQLSGNLPNSLGYLENLRELKLSHNSFRGSLPNSIGNLSSLEELYLSYNQMGGNITPGLGQLFSLIVLDLSENSWECVLTEAHFANLSNLRELSMNKASPNISLVFNINPDWVPPFRLTYINIRSCQLGPKFPTWLLRNQSKVTTLVLNNARISGTLPEWFWKLNLQLSELDVSYNDLNGQVPNSIQFSFPSTVDLGTNRFEGPLPLWSSNVTALYLRDNRFSGPVPPEIGEVLPSLTDLDLAQNSLNGSIPSSIGNLKALTNLDISNNHLSGEIPDFWNDMSDLYYIDMSNNSLSGSIPSSMGSLKFLHFLLLCRNNLSGEIPYFLQNCRMMDTLDIGDNQISGLLPPWIGVNMPSLLILRARNNSLTGIIPSQICELLSLHILDLSLNKLSGLIPPCFGNLEGFKTEINLVRYESQIQVMAKGNILLYYSTLYLVNSLDLSSNNLSGDIPERLMSLVKLGTLNLSINHLTGKIPVKIGDLEWLETLDLSQNQLTGHIPSSMASLSFLNHLNLSYNQLSGQIPTGNQLQTLDDPSIYEGNLALCGPPLATKCNKTGGSTFDRGGEETDDDEGKFTKDLVLASA
ncbi:Non-specific serine/threonine protein kinase [Bertholletia excelsa]